MTFKILKYSTYIIIIAGVFGVYSKADSIKRPLDLELVPEIEINETLSGSHITTFDYRTNKHQEIDFFSDGRVILESRSTKRMGLWYTDSQGRHCIRWENEDKSSCALVMQDDDGDWVKVKDGEVIKSYESIKPIHSNKTQKKFEFKRRLFQF